MTATPDLRQLVGVRPSARQLRWQQTEFYGFVHVGMNTMTDREWGDGTEDPAWFDPDDLDAASWVRACADAGMRALVLTAKHHDGFCLWPTATTAHSVASSPWRGGEGDLVAEVATACAAVGIGFGVYLSPWDRHEPSYGTGTAYDDLYVAQLTELLTGYGDLFCVWLDGANGEGPDGRVQTYDWDRYHQVIRSLQPQAVICVCGPDVRWVGNEAGHTRPDEWSVVPAELRSAERTASRSQQADDGEFSRAVRSDDEDLGSRTALAGYTGVPVWYPAEVNTSMRPGWFHHPVEDDQVRTGAELFEIHLRSVGGNATLLLNVTPDRHGRLPEPDRRELADLGRRLRTWQAGVGSGDLPPTRSSERMTGPGSLPDGTGARSWHAAPDDPNPTVVLRWTQPVAVAAVEVREDLAAGQRIESVEVLVPDGDGLAVVASAGAVGHCRVLTFDRVTTDEVHVRITAARAAPVLASVAAVSAHACETARAPRPVGIA